MQRLGRFLNSQKSGADFLKSVFLNSGRVLYTRRHLYKPVAVLWEVHLD